MSITVSDSPVTLSTDPDGVIRVAGTRVTLDSIVLAYQEGLSAEAIAERYPSLPLGEVYAAIGYYLKHLESVDAYLQARRARAAEVRRENETRFDPNGIRARLLARRN